MVGEPITGEHRNLLERAGFFEQMSGTGNHGERALARDCGLRPSIQFQRHFIASPDDQQRRCVDFGQRPTGEVGPPAAGDHRCDVHSGIGGRDQGRARSRTGTEIADRQRRGIRLAVSQLVTSTSR